MIRSFAAAILAMPILASCATMPEPCTAEWFDWKTERIIGQFAYDHRDEIGRLRDIAPALLGGDSGTGQLGSQLTLLFTAVGVAKMVSDFGNYAWPEISSAVAECSAPPQASRLFADMLRREGVDDRAVRAIEELGLLMDRGL
jgi:hypothetical protein